MLAAYLPLLLSALAFVISVFSFFYFRSFLRARTSQARILAEMREEVNSILKSINETTDRDISLIEEREKNLKVLLEEIEKRLKVYIREVEVRRGAEEAYRELGKNRYRLPKDLHSESELRGESEAPGEPEMRREAVQQNRNVDSREVAHQAKPNPAFPVPSFEVKSESSPGRSQENPLPLGEQVLDLVKAGFSVPVIASRLGVSIAEVEFAAALLEKKH
jgi:hypothetical protein